MIDNSDILERAGEQFGETLMRVIGDVRVKIMTVISVDDNFAYCNIYEDDEALPVSLSFLSYEDAYLKITPTVGSSVGVGYFNGDDNTPFFVKFSVVDKIEFVRNETSIKFETPNDSIEVVNGENVVSIDNNGIRLNVMDSSEIHLMDGLIQMNGGELDGLVAINALTSRLNKLQSEIDSIVQSYNGHVHTFTWAGTSGTANTLATASTATSPSTFDKSEYENKNITQ